MWWSWRYFVAVSLVGLILIIIGLAVALFPQSITSNIVILLGIMLIVHSTTYSIVAIWNDSRHKYSKGKETSKSTREDTEKITKKGFSPKLPDKETKFPEAADILLINDIQGSKSEMNLLEDETIVLDDGYVGYRQKLTLTNKRIIYSQKEGTIKTTWNKMLEIPLDQIKEAYIGTTGELSELSSAMLRMKDGNIRKLNVNFGGGAAQRMHVATDIVTNAAVRTKTLSDRWVKAINQQLRQKTESLSEMYEEITLKLEDTLKETKKK